MVTLDIFKLSNTDEYVPTSGAMQIILRRNDYDYVTPVRSTRSGEMISSLPRLCSSSRQLDLYYRSGLMKVSSCHVLSVSYSL